MAFKNDGETSSPKWKPPCAETVCFLPQVSKAETEKRTWTRCRRRLHERPANRGPVQKLAGANIHGSTADKTARVIEQFGPLVNPPAWHTKRRQPLRTSLGCDSNSGHHHGEGLRIERLRLVHWTIAKRKTFLEMRSVKWWIRPK